MLAILIAVAVLPNSILEARAGSSAGPVPAPASLAGVDLAPGAAPGLYPGGTSFVFIGDPPDRAMVVDGEGRVVRRLEPAWRGAGASILIWDGRDAAEHPVRGRARLALWRAGGISAVELRAVRWSSRVRAGSGTSFLLRAVAP